VNVGRCNSACVCEYVWCVSVCVCVCVKVRKSEGEAPRSGDATSAAARGDVLDSLLSVHGVVHLYDSASADHCSPTPVPSSFNGTHSSLRLSSLPTRFTVSFLPSRRYSSAGTSHGPVSVRLSVCLSQVGVLSKRLDESSWFLAWELPSTHPTLY